MNDKGEFVLSLVAVIGIALLLLYALSVTSFGANLFYKLKAKPTGAQ